MSCTEAYASGFVNTYSQSLHAGNVATGRGPAHKPSAFTQHGSSPIMGHSAAKQYPTLPPLPPPLQPFCTRGAICGESRTGRNPNAVCFESNTAIYDNCPGVCMALGSRVQMWPCCATAPLLTPPTMLTAALPARCRHRPVPPTDSRR